ncbi:hydroxyphenylacetyl-CoA thioesterase PaaI [Truepera radiovictrix]|uniref:Phenylacetic acid degradation protein PaaD n=1 Tax=Truepera radiovictrix (strain DSM 17093 / CIP 108686 / LMG 22925 / RQ-24) TaxID=649638 RepID=D7CQM6_TRURR|nr:hydroxyphenylacetyl-CoA thioesterase PaaI [Truepera radiovictrix]ADI15010.1 phenylacetic acid degradation protein PaaD [Truepera radiovictrix DSM 17093]WMT56437.1 hydroxyphenylacetyl-CoA thioesterase PaaI [Truepera radiovictrix]
MSQSRPARGFAEHVGLEVLAAGEGRAHVRATVTAAHLNLHGTAHGGFLYTLADEAFALASNSRGAAVALSVRMDYLSAVRAGDVLEALASEEHLGRRVATYRVEVTKAGEKVALFTGTVFRLSPRQGRA